MTKRTRAIVVASVMLNGVLAAAFIYHATKPPALVTAATPEASLAVAPGASMAPGRVVPVPVPSHSDRFDWKEIESTDYQQYMANLRSVGCPEETVRDLIIAEVNKLFAPRLAALVAQMRGYRYWKPGNKPLEGVRQQLAALQKEKGGLLQTLLGIERDPNEKWVNLSAEAVAELGRYSFLPAEKEAQVRAIMDRYKQMEAVRRSGELPGPGDSTRKLREQRREELAQVLTSEELHEMELRDSNTADSVRSRFGAAELTEEEYRKLFALRKTYEDEQGVVPDYSDPEKARRRSEARRELEEAYKTTLGEDRHAAIQRQQDPSWRGLSNVGQQHGLPQATLDQAYQYQRLASEQVAALFANPEISSPNRRAAVQQIQQELERQMATLMGTDAYNDYRRTSPQFSFSSGGDTMVLSAPPGVPLGVPEGALQQRVITTVREVQGDTRVTITPR